MRQLTNSLFFTLGALVGSQVKLRFDHYQQPYPMPHQWGQLLDHPWRLRYRKPAEMVDTLGITPQMTLLDLGCGTGVFTVELAQRIGPDGAVHAIDLQEPFLRQAQQRVQSTGRQERVYFHHGGAYALPLETNSVDLALLVATLSQIPNKLVALSELRRVLKPGARVVISEELPDPAYAPPPLVRRWLVAAGYRFVMQSGTPFCYSQQYVTDKEPNTVDVVAKVTHNVTVVDTI